MNRYSWYLVKARLFFKLVLFILCSFLFIGFSTAPGEVIPTVRSLIFEGNLSVSSNQLMEVISTKKGEKFTEDMLNADAGRILSFYKSQAYLHAHVDSIRLKRDTINQDVEVQIFLSEGKPSIVRRLELEGCYNLTASELYSNMQLQVGDYFVPSILEQDIQTILNLYERRGYPIARVKIRDISFIDAVDEMSTTVQLHIDEGKEIYVVEMRIEGNRTTKDYVIMREARLKEDEIFSGDLPERIKRRLDRLQLFSSVSLPELYLTEKEKAGLLVKIVEGNQNSFDGVVGYIPSSQSGGDGYFTGLINISLRNLFGTGRKLSARWYQENKLSRETELHYLEPWVASYPVNAQLGFFQRKQDSTYVRMQYDVAAELMITEEFSVGASFSHGNVYPTEGYGRLVMAESKTISFGASVRYDSRDNPTTPTGGILYITEYQTGTKQSTSSSILQLNSKSTTSRIVFDLLYYLSPFYRQVVAAELHIRDYNTSTFDMSDLFRLGGASTLRGYREGQFLGSRLVWTNLEYRLLVAPRSFFYGFFDIGYIAQPGITNIGLKASEQTKIGYGVGVRLDSALGLIGVSFALGEGDTFSTSKIHIRLINEF